MHSAQASSNPLSQDFNLVSLLCFAFPTMLTMLFMGFYTMVDTIFVARFVNTNALSALNMVCPVLNLIVGLGTMLATGGSAIIAGKLGAGKKQRAAQDFTLLIATGFLLGLLIAALGIAFLDNIIWGLGANAVLFPYCKEYLFILLLFAPANMLQVLFQNLLVTAGHPPIGMLLGISAGAVNILLDYLLMVPLQMGIQGAALGTGIGYLLPASIGALFFAFSKGSLHFCRPVLDLAVLTKSCSNGVSELVSQSATAVTTVLFNRTMMGMLGEQGVAAITIIIYTQFLLSTLFIGFSIGVAPVLSYHYGKKSNWRLKHLFLICAMFITLFSMFVFGAAFIFAPDLIGLFAAPETAVYEIAREGFSIFSVSFLFCGWNIFVSAAFTALSNGKSSAILSFLRTFGLITVFLLTLPKLLGVVGVWLAVPLAECFTVIVSMVLLHSFYASTFL